MSRLAKKPIIVRPGITVTTDGDLMMVKGPKGELKVKILPYVKAEIKGDSIEVNSSKDFKQSRSNVGTLWSLINNAVIGVTEGFSKELEIEGIGFRATIEGKTLVLNLGFSNPVRFDIPEGLKILVEKSIIKIEGIDKEKVGQAAAEIRAFKKPEPYKGKGIHYVGEVIRRKAGKKATATAS